MKIVWMCYDFIVLSVHSPYRWRIQWSTCRVLPSSSYVCPSVADQSELYTDHLHPHQGQWGLHGTEGWSQRYLKETTENISTVAYKGRSMLIAHPTECWSKYIRKMCEKSLLMLTLNLYMDISGCWAML